MMGAAARMQGYDALEGFGITRSKNKKVDATPKKKKEIFENRCFSNR